MVKMDREDQEGIYIYIYIREREREKRERERVCKRKWQKWLTANEE